MAEEYSGSLELTWTNKHMRLLAHDDGTYQWVPRHDYRVSEVRLLRDASSVGGVSAFRHRDNLLIRGDALNALTSLSGLSEFRDEYVGRVKLIYIDPPFNTGEVFPDYEDNLEHSVWLTLIRDRLMMLRDFLSPDGSMWLHLSDDEAHRARVVLDEIFGSDQLVGSVVWEKLYARKSNQEFSTSHDYIWVYAIDKTKFRTNLLAPSPEQLSRYRNPDNDPKGSWQSVSFHVRTDNPQRRKEYRYTIELPSGRRVRPPRGRHWNGKIDRYERLKAAGQLYFGEKGDSLPRYKMYLADTDPGLVPTSWWSREEVGDNNESKAELQALFPEIEDVFQTPKPERLLERIIHIASNPGDIVLDCFAGSGTTPAVAHKMGRRWVAVEWSDETLATYAIPRLTRVIEGRDPGGVTQETREVVIGDLPTGIPVDDARTAVNTLRKAAKEGLFTDQSEALSADLARRVAKRLAQASKTELETIRCWEGGGGFRILDVSPSMFEEHDGVVYLAEWATGGDLAEATAAQLGYAYEPEPPFAGRKNRSRLAVVDGLVTTDVVDLLAAQLGDSEQLVICGTSLASGAREHLRSIVPGSRLRKIPSSILAEYRLAYRTRRARELRVSKADAPTRSIEAEPASAGRGDSS